MFMFWNDVTRFLYVLYAVKWEMESMLMLEKYPGFIEGVIENDWYSLLQRVTLGVDDTTKHNLWD